MKPAAPFLVLLCFSSPARAEPFIVDVRLATSGVFSCNSGISCSGQGTNTIAIASGASIATLTFRGVDTSFEASSAMTRQIPVGEFEFTAPDGYLVPGSNPNRWVVRFDFHYSQILPAPKSGTKTLRFGFSGAPYFQWLLGSGTFSAPVGPNPFNYELIVYSLRPYPVRINPNTTQPFMADVGVVPEPGTIVLFGSGLVGTALARRRRSRKDRKAPEAA